MDFFNQINMLYGTITEFCTPQECPVMSAGPKWVIVQGVHFTLCLFSRLVIHRSPSPCPLQIRVSLV